MPVADVVARDCFDKILAENDDLRAIIDTYGGLENIQSAFVKLHEIENADVREVVMCRDCRYYNKQYFVTGKCYGTFCDILRRDFGKDFFCGMGEKREAKT